MYLLACLLCRSAPVGGNAQLPASTDDDEWISFNHRLSGDRYSNLSQINEGNVNQLKEVCHVKLAESGSLSSGPIVADGVMYVTMNNSTVALDPSTCAIGWKADYLPAQPTILPNNRGVAFLAGRLYRGTGDGRLVSYDAMTGKELWRKKIGDPARGEFVSAAPIVWRRSVFVGLSGGELGVRGKMMAFDALTGKRLWSFDLIPHAGKIGAKSWGGDSWKHGGGATWSSYSLDEQTGELFVSVDNPAPAFYGSVRPGDNLFTNSVVSLDAKSGRLLWYTQLRKHDTRDYGASAPAVLVTVAGRAVVAQGSKDGYLYVIDRHDHRVRFRTAVTTVAPGTLESASDDPVICPGIAGGFLYNSPSFVPTSRSFISGAVDWCSIIHPDSTPPRYAPPNEFAGGRQEHVGPSSGWITSVDAVDGHVVWRVHTGAPVFAAVTSTAGGLTFSGDHNGDLYAYRSSNGAVLWHHNTGASIAGGLVTYRMASKQYLAVESGSATLSPPTATGPPSIVVFGLDPAASAVTPDR